MPDNDMPDNNADQRQPEFNLFVFALVCLLGLFGIVMCVSSLLGHGPSFPRGPTLLPTPPPLN